MERLYYSEMGVARGVGFISWSSTGVTRGALGVALSDMGAIMFAACSLVSGLGFDGGGAEPLLPSDSGDGDRLWSRGMTPSACRLAADI
jgi:hypothetical protein